MTRAGAALLVLLAAAPAGAQHDAAAKLAEAQRAFVEGDYEGAMRITAPIVQGGISEADRAEALRLHCVSLFLLGHQAQAETYLYQWLESQARAGIDAHLDPAVVPPEAVAFLESIRANHEGDLRKLKPPKRKSRSRWGTIVPVYGQYQNEQMWKVWLFGVTEGVLLATSITTYAVLASKCGDDLTCKLKRSTADNLLLTNRLSGGLLIGVCLIGIVDAMWNYDPNPATEERPSVGLMPEEGGATLVFSMGF